MNVWSATQRTMAKYVRVGAMVSVAGVGIGALTHCGLLWVHVHTSGKCRQRHENWVRVKMLRGGERET
jgi:hypothetical protein